MTTLHEALQCLKPTSWEEVPHSPQELRGYIRDIFKQGRLVAESLPDPPQYEHEEQYGVESETAEPRRRVIPSSVRVGETDPDITSLQKQWGKPIKMGGAKDNPLGVHVWKLNANDNGGQWFGRRSVHEGLPFTRWQEKLSSEYDETLKVNRKKIEKGQTPDHSIRGIGAEEKVESVEVLDDDGSVMGQVTLYHVSAQFPKPTAPRDFVTLIITSEHGLRIGGTKQQGRSWMMISKPCEHPDIPHKAGYTRGEYESVELVREIPKQDIESSSGSVSSEKKPQKQSSSDESKAQSPDADGTSDDEDTNPVEWIMVTRSDPGGNIPKWMVNKGTPGSVGADAAKFLTWAIKDANAPNKNSTQGDPADDEHSEEEEEEEEDNTDLTDTDAQSHHGLIASVTGLLNTGIERYAPQAFLDYIPHHHDIPGSFPQADADDSVSQSTKASSNKHDRSADYLDPDQASFSSTRSEGVTPVMDLGPNHLPPKELMEMTKDGKLSSHEKELAKLALRKREIDAKLDSIRAELDKSQVPSQSILAPPPKGLVNDVDSDTSGMLKRAAENRSSTPASSHRGGDSSEGQSSQTQTPEPPAHVHKAALQLLHEESKLLKQLRKIEGSQIKIASKIEAKQKKVAERSEKSKSKSEVESLRSEVKDLKKEVGRLRAERQKWVDLVATLQAENTKLAAASTESRSGKA
ncbi:hypothetical protein N7448_003224 [Penicillium atrosanguineum]|uniref:DUF3074 domain-containing protein n=1 Tax=Penicillium atrosanguineum TaxID=1132637 RepID=A0A9W9L6W1_9EURO|nr:uncharacterized protein N7443_002197 [Penicillium atrosanguineum]KAJ5139816.1 hypothetical protein N7448_003224 [Penicillium atrosanguineum]KAJ5309736.1 hypothetical protein N7443_002197 [Penicillium atrosanguineum]KAJ5315258.1 hypothetical protein N7476_005565 [Penicillium atrosanguineum]